MSLLVARERIFEMNRSNDVITGGLKAVLLHETAPAWVLARNN